MYFIRSESEREMKEKGHLLPVHTICKTSMQGKHCILELYGCDQLILNNENLIKISLQNAAEVAGATLLKMVTHSFSPQGVTGLALLSESHISIHTWPESQYAAIDVFTCGMRTSPEKACQFLVKEFRAKKFSLKSFFRETSLKNDSLMRLP